MAENDALSSFDFSKVTGGGLFVKFEPGKPLTLRVLTVDPVVTNESYEDRKTGEPVVTTKFSFVVYNFTEQKAQIWKATGNTAKQIGALHTDPDFGADIRKIDVKVTAPAKGEIKAYDIQVLPKTNELTTEQIKECAAIKLDEKIEGGQRMSFYNPDEYNAKAKVKAEVEERMDVVIDEVPDEPINLDDIPF